MSSKASIAKLEESIMKLEAALNYYAELLSTKKAFPSELEAIKLKREHLKKEILKLTLKNKKLIKALEEEFRPVDAGGGAD